MSKYLVKGNYVGAVSVTLTPLMAPEDVDAAAAKAPRTARREPEPSPADADHRSASRTPASWRPEQCRSPLDEMATDQRS